jgi:tRNA(fMet)-specific endonuclease VapC
LTHYLLDTNIISHLAKSPDGALAKYVRRLPPSSLFTSILVSAEIQFGLAKRGSEKLAHHMMLTLEAFPILPFESPADRIYGDIRHQLERSGTPIGNNDTLIAAHALALGCTVVTANDREFQRVPGLAVENWIAQVFR